MKLSICIPVYKVEAFIEKCARSLFEQTARDLEYIFIDDCSPDGSIAKLKEIAREYPLREAQMKIVRHEKNSGLIRARKTGLAHATGDYVTHCDPDDWVDPDFYGKMLARAEETGADMVFAPMVRNENEPLQGRMNIDFEGSGADYLALVGQLVAFNSTVNKIYRRAIACDPAIDVPDSIKIGEDLCRTMQTVWRCAKVASVKDTYYHYRENLESMSQKFDCRKAIDNLAEVYRVLVRNVPAEVGTPLRKQLLRDVVFHGMKFGVMSKDELASWKGEFAALADVPWPKDTSWKRRVMLAITVRSYGLAKWMFRWLSDGKITGF